MAVAKAKGRPKKLGTLPCPDPTCDGYLQLGRIRQKKIRNRPTGRYEERDWFRHNDSNIKEHYIDNFTRPPPDKMPVMDEIHDLHTRVAHKVEKMVKRIRTFPLDKEDLL